MKPNAKAQAVLDAIAYITIATVNEDGQPSAGVYMQGRAFELTDEQEVMQSAMVFKDDPYNPSDGAQYLGDFPRRIYKFVPEEIWLNDDSQVNGQFVDVRVGAAEV